MSEVPLYLGAVAVGTTSLHAPLLQILPAKSNEDARPRLEMAPILNCSNGMKWLLIFPAEDSAWGLAPGLYEELRMRSYQFCASQGSYENLARVVEGKIAMRPSS